jgi:hypothetical protein
MHTDLSPSLTPIGFLRRAAACVLAAYLVLFFADGFCSVVDDSLIGFAGIVRFSGFREGVADACFLASLAVLFLSFLTPLLPRRFLYPPIAFAVLCALVFPLLRQPLPEWLERGLAAFQLVLALGMLAWVWKGLHPAPFSERIVGRRIFSWRHLLLSGAALVVLLLPALGVWCLSAGARQMEQMDGGFMLFHWNRLEMKTKKYVRDDGKEIDLVPMIHIGEGGFYARVAASFPPDTVVLTEGVTDQARLAPRLDYTPVAKAMGLSSQMEEFQTLQKQSRAEIRPADVDYADFSPATREMIGLVSRFAEHPDAAHYIAFVQEWRRREDADPGMQDRFFQEILLSRNAHVLKETETALKTTGRVVLPWGALHMPGLEKGILKMGFRPSETHSLDAIRYGTVLVAVLNASGKSANAPAPVPAPSAH